MNTVFILCALVGCTLLVLQTVMQLVGLGHDAAGDVGMDVDTGGGHSAGGVEQHHYAGTTQHHGSTPLPKIVQFLSYQTIVAFLAFFGLGGLAASQAQIPPAGSGILAVTAGLLSAVVITYVLKGFRKLQRDGTVRIHRALDCPGRVYLRIPGEESGVGKVTVTVQGRTVEMLAKTKGPLLPTGTAVVVVDILDQQTVEVAAAANESRAAG